MQTIEQFYGTWRLIKATVRKPTGETYIFGKDAIGYLMYSPTGIMAVQIMAQGRDPNIRQPKYDAYFANYDIDKDNEMIHHHVEGSILTKRVGTILSRKYKFSGKRLSLKPDNDRELIWEKMD